MNCFISLLLCSLVINLCGGEGLKSFDKNMNLYDIEGTVYPPDVMPNSKKLLWLTDTKVYLKGGCFIGFLRFVLLHIYIITILVSCGFSP